MPLKRDESFVPLAPSSLAADARPDYRVTVMSQAENAQPFRPLGLAPGAGIAAAHDSSHEPRVSVQREGDRVTSIQIQCTCGQLIELACVYESAAMAKAPPPASPPVTTAAPPAAEVTLPIPQPASPAVAPAPTTSTSALPASPDTAPPAASAPPAAAPSKRSKAKGR